MDHVSKIKEAEKKAFQIVEEAKLARVQRLEEASSEAQGIIKKYDETMQESFETTFNENSDGVVVKKRAKKEILDLMLTGVDKKFYKEKVEIIDLVFTTAITFNPDSVCK